MTQAKTITVEPRENTGSRASQKLRMQGLVPGNVCGHKQDSASITVKNSDIEDIIHHREKVVELECNGKKETAVVKELQWDTFSTHVQHIDFLRVDPEERVEVEVAIEIHGVAPGVVAGGALDHAHRSLRIECPVIAIPHAIEARVGSLEIGDALHVKDLELPENVHSLESDSIIVAQVIKSAGS